MNPPIHQFAWSHDKEQLPYPFIRLQILIIFTLLVLNYRNFLTR